jgi:hypothetical protein
MEFEGASAVIFLSIVLAVVLLIILIISSPLLILAALLKRRAVRYMNERASTILTQFDPPKDLKPAEIGFLYDMKCDQKEVWGTLLWLHKEKIIRITGKTTVEIIDTKRYELLESFEKAAVNLIDKTAPGAAGKAVTFQHVNANTATHTESTITLPTFRSLGNFTRLVQDSLKAKGYKSKRLLPSIVWYGWLVGLTIPIGAIIYFYSQPVIFDGIERAPWSFQSLTTGLFITLGFGFFLWPVVWGFGMLVVYLWGKIAGNYWLNTADVRKVWPELEGYRLFLKQVEIDNIEFATKTNDIEAAVDASLPYTVIFGFNSNWQNVLTARK